MVDFSASGIYGLPPTTADTLSGVQGGPILGWLQEAVTEGDRINRQDPGYDKIELGMRYIEGEQRADLTSPIDSSGAARPGYLPRMTINQSRKATQVRVSALTDIKPTFQFRSTNPAFQFQGDLLNKLVVAAWITRMLDLEIGDTVKYAHAAGTGDLVVEWDPNLPGGGDHAFSSRDPRDTLPIRPSNQRSIQLWQGLTLREEHSVNVLKALYPDKAHLFIPSTDSILSRVMGRFRSAMARIISPQGDTLSGLAAGVHTQKPKSGGVVFYRTYLRDGTKNLTGKPLVIGSPTTNWSYIVQPQGMLYPRGRLICWTDRGIAFDGPNPYWHGMFPVNRLLLWSVPWRFLGISLLNDLLPIQDGINDIANDLALGIKKWMAPAVSYSREAVSENFMRLFDPRRPGAKVKLNATAGDGFKIHEGPNPQVLSIGLEFLEKLIAEFDNLSGTANLQQLLQLRQLPSGDTLRQYYEALTPELRSEGRMIEAFLRDVAEQMKVNIFQFMSTARRLALLGDADLSLEDFDYDPASLVPALVSGDPNYTPELDADKPRDERAQFFHRYFIFTVAPNSLLAMHAQEQKMIRLQLARMGYYDFWSLGEALEIPNIGTPPPMPLPPLTPPTPEDQQAAAVNAAAAVAGLPPPSPSKYILDPASGQIMEVRTPLTVTERLMAQQQLGIGMTENPAGRKASGQQEPQIETKKDQTGAPRQTVTESKK